MRKLIEETVIENYKIKGLYEMNLEWINHRRVIPLKNVVVWDGNIRPISIEKWIKELSDTELLKILEGQMCQKFR